MTSTPSRASILAATVSNAVGRKPTMSVFMGKLFIDDGRWGAGSQQS